MPNCSIKGSLDTPPHSNAGINNTEANFDARDIHSVPDSHFFSLECYKKIISLIIALLLPCSPAAVLGGIRTIIVDPLKRMRGGWSRPHIGIEIFETSLPPLANLDPASPIVMVRFALWIIAALPHGAPDEELRSLSLSVNEVFGFANLPTKATT